MTWKAHLLGGEFNSAGTDVPPDRDCHRARITHKSHGPTFTVELVDADRPRRMATAMLGRRANGIEDLMFELGAVVWVRLLEGETRGEIVAPISGHRKKWQLE